MIWLVECRRGKKDLQPGNILLLSRTLQGTDDLGNTKLWGELPGLTSTSPATGAEVSHWQFWSRAEGLNSAPVVLWDAQGQQFWDRGSFEPPHHPAMQQHSEQLSTGWSFCCCSRTCSLRCAQVVVRATRKRPSLGTYPALRASCDAQRSHLFPSRSCCPSHCNLLCLL